MPRWLLNWNDVIELGGLGEQVVSQFQKTISCARLFRFPTSRNATGGHLPQKRAVHFPISPMRTPLI
jgi:hypothetical protein